MSTSESTDDRYLPGTLNPEAMKTPGDHHDGFTPGTDGNNLFAQIRGSFQRGQSLNSFEGVNRYKAMVISEVRTTKVGGFMGMGGKERYEFRVRIPELHSGIQDPCAIPPDGGSGANLEDKVRKFVALHPMAYSASDTEGGNSELPEPAMGDIVWIEFEKGPAAGRMGGATYVGRYSAGQGTNNISDACSDLAEMVANGNGSTVGGNDYAPSGGYPGDPSTWPVSQTAEHAQGEEAEDIHEIARAYYEEHDFTWYDDPMIMNLWGMRNTSTVSSNKFEDKIMCGYTDDSGQKHVYTWPATTRPGLYAMTDGRSSIAIMVPSAPNYWATPDPIRSGRPSSKGQKTYYYGNQNPVRGRNSDSAKSYAGIGPDPVQAYRDSNNDNVFNYDPNSIGGCQQCQIHGTKPDPEGYVANNMSGRRADGSTWSWGEGCQVWQSWADYEFWLSLWQQQIQKGTREWVDYVLIRAEDAPDLWGTTPQSDSDEPQPGDPVE